MLLNQSKCKEDEIETFLWTQMVIMFHISQTNPHLNYCGPWYTLTFHYHKGMKLEPLPTTADLYFSSYLNSGSNENHINSHLCSPSHNTNHDAWVSGSTDVFQLSTLNCEFRVSKNQILVRFVQYYFDTGKKKGS